MVNTFPANLGLGIVKLRVSLFISSNLPASFPVFDSMGSPIVAVGPLARTFQKKKSAVVHRVQMDLQKRFLAFYKSPVCHAAGFHRSEAFLKN